MNLKKNDEVIVDMDNILDCGKCVSSSIEKSKDDISFPLNKVLRIVSKKDEKQLSNNSVDEEKALLYARKIAKDLDLQMSIISAHYTYDRNQLFFNFTADERIDFRNLAKKLAQKYKTRIELRQIGVRDKAKLIGGLGPCGLFLCCNSFLTDFNSVSINMAKNQLLALNPSKINGVCGRLLCCLNYEDEVYSELKKNIPSVGTIVDTEYGNGKVVSINVLKQTYKVDINNNIYEVKVG